MRYMIVLVDYKMILVVNLRTEKVCEMLHYDFKPLLGVFFLNNQNAGHQNEDIVFSMVFQDKLVYFKIAQANNAQDKVFEYKTLKFGTIGLTNFYFNLRYSILILERKDKNFDFFNLSHDKYYTKGHPFNFPYKNTRNPLESRSSISKFLGMFRPSIKKMKDDYSLDEEQSKETLYKRNQFFLETM
jgi:hypothetical protein